MKITGVIPARYASTRFPGKPLADICGKPMIQWVWEAASGVSEFSALYVATDDERIKNVAGGFGADVLMTSPACGTLIDRLWEVSESVSADYYVTVNGDEPLIESEVISAVLPTKIEKTRPVVRALMREFTNPAEVMDNGNIKVVVGESGEALYISRSPIPYPQKTTAFTYKKTVGVQCYNKAALDFYVSHNETRLEYIEDCADIRFLDYGIPYSFILVNSDSLAVDTEKDLEKVRKVTAEKLQKER
jgi:3-deoxy-manno-octulosonate cytidylyltransferase (CMP-KDO synthetase)